MEEWVALYQKHKDWVILVIGWLLSIPTGILVNRLDAYFKNRSEERRIKTLVAYYTRVVMQREELRSSSNDLPTRFRWNDSKTLKMFLLTWVMMLVQTFSAPIVLDKFGKHASDLYFYTILILAFLLNSAVIGIEQIEDNIFKDAIHFSEYRKKTIAKLTKLEYDLSVLDRIDKLISQRYADGSDDSKPMSTA